MNLAAQLGNSFKSGNNLIRLIYFNVGLFLISSLFQLFNYLFIKNIDFLSWISLPASLIQLAHRPWSLFTYMFFHADVWHILFNMIFLYWFGLIFIQFLNQRLLLNVYILGGITGGLFYLFAYNLFPVFLTSFYSSGLIGASAAAMAIMTVTALMVPNFTVKLFMLWPVQLKYIALVLVVLDLATIPKENAGGHLSHLGGVIFGVIFMLQYKKRKDITSWMNPIVDNVKGLFKKKKKMKVTYKRPVSDFEYNKRKFDESKELDRILDKIKIGGYDSLTKAEKELLFKQRG